MEANNNGSALAENERVWPEPEPPSVNNLPVALMTPAMLPRGMSKWLVDCAERACVPLDFVGAAAVVVLGSLLGSKLGVRPKRFDSSFFLLAPNYGVIVGPPGVLKSPMLAEVMAPLYQLNAKAKQVFEAKLDGKEFADMLTNTTLGTILKEAKEAESKGADTAELAKKYADAKRRSEAPMRRRYIVNNITLEKLEIRLKENPNGLLYFRDELVGLLKLMEQRGHESDRTFLLEAHNAMNAYEVDRVTRTEVEIDRLILAVLGSATDDGIQQYLRMNYSKPSGDGLMQRFQIAVYPDTIPWVKCDRPPDERAYALAMQLFERLDADEKFNAKNFKTDARTGLPFIQFNNAAQNIFDRFRDKLEPRVRNGSNDHPAMISHLSKYRSLMPKLALLFCVIECLSMNKPIVAIDERCARLAVTWCDYLETHARRLYGGLLSIGEVTARLLFDRLKDGELNDGFTLRELERKGWSGLTDRDTNAEACERLVEAYCLESEIIGLAEKRGRPAKRYWINPKVLLGVGSKRAARIEGRVN
jgi:hypothetical protein